MKILKWLGVAFLTIIGAAAVALVWLISTEPDLSKFENHYAYPAVSDVTVRFFGTSSMLFSDGETNIMIDGWFTRPSTLKLLIGKVEPDITAIELGLARLGNPTVAALIAAHSHVDHALDVAEVAMRTGALLVGSESTANIGRGGNLSERQIRVVEDGERLQFGDFAVTMIASRHWFPATDSLLAGTDVQPTIEEPLVPPARSYAYRAGVTFSVVIEHPAGSALIQSSAGFKESSLDGFDVDTVYLGVGGLANQTDDYQDSHWREVVASTRPEGIYIIHWDSLNYPLTNTEDRPVAPNRLWSDVLGMRAAASIHAALERAKAAGVPARLLPMWTPVDAFRVVSAR